jgi:hypothetical protein
MNDLRDLVEEIEERVRAARAAIAGDVLAGDGQAVELALDQCRSELSAIDVAIDRARMLGVVPR